MSTEQISTAGKDVWNNQADDHVPFWRSTPTSMTHSSKNKQTDKSKKKIWIPNHLKWFWSTDHLVSSSLLHSCLCHSLFQQPSSFQIRTNCTRIKMHRRKFFISGGGFFNLVFSLPYTPKRQTAEIKEAKDWEEWGGNINLARRSGNHDWDIEQPHSNVTNVINK